LELRDKLDVAITAGAAASAARGSDVLNALVALGYNDREASWAVKQLPDDVALADGIRQALKLLSKS
ncbi:MAG TPA: Holliday junction branch migration protein RuvA, partial [Burkholderiales bacterium]|nr:Holliday junction branch migration protein RuvA [Burkholderiales bacterium]